ncbi:MAG: hypothetical protein WDN03_15010 [Rhizomicrobium sp.]
MAVGEAACVSVHGANRLGSNSLIDLVVFGKAAGAHAAESLKGVTGHHDLPKGAGDEALARLDKFRTPRAARRPPNCALPCRRRCRPTPPCSAPARRWSRDRRTSTRSTAA